MSFTVDILDMNFDVQFSGDFITKEHVDKVMDDVVEKCLQILSATLAKIADTKDKDGRKIKRIIIKTVVKEPIITDNYEEVIIDKPNFVVH